MKKILLLTALLIGATSVEAQSLLLKDENGNNLNGGNITVNGMPSDQDLLAHIYVENTTATSMDVKVKRYETSVDGGTENYFCWFVCYGNMTAGSNPIFPATGSGQANHKRTIGAGATDTTLSAHHVPNGVSGVSCYTYVVFDGNNPNDSVSVEVCYNVTTNSTDDLEKVNAHHYPNPATDQLNVVLDGLNGATAQLEVYNMVGKVIDRRTVSNSRTILNTSNYGSGVYFYSVKNNNNVLVTRKFIVR